MTMNEDILVTKSLYDDFSQPTASRDFEVIVEEQSLFLNAGWLAELSPWFGDYCFGETPRTRIHVDDIRYQDMLEFFRCIFFCPMRKPLSMGNVDLVMRCASRFEMRPVVARCERFISHNANTFERNNLFKVTCALSRCDPNSTTMSVLVDRLASIREEDLSSMNFDKMPGEVVADVYREKMRRRREATRSIFYLGSNLYSARRNQATRLLIFPNVLEVIILTPILHKLTSSRTLQPHVVLILLLVCIRSPIHVNLVYREVLTSIICPFFCSSIYYCVINRLV